MRRRRGGWAVGSACASSRGDARSDPGRPGSGFAERGPGRVQAWEIQPVEAGLAAEAEEEADLETGRSQVVVDLAGSVPVKIEGGLHLDDELAVDDDVDALAAENPALAANDDADLAIDAVAPEPQLVLEGENVKALEESEAQGVVDLEERPDDGMGELLFDQCVAGHGCNLASRRRIALISRLRAGAFDCARPSHHASGSPGLSGVTGCCGFYG